MTEPIRVGELLPGVVAEAIARAGPGYDRWAEQAPGLRVVLWQNGRSALLMSRHLRDSETLFATVDARAAEVVFEASEEQILGS